MYILWKMIAWFISRQIIVRWLIEQAVKTPYAHITSQNDINDVYMYRYWLFNPYRECEGLKQYPWFPLSIRLHHIKREDIDRDWHDHPWNARTFILDGWYVEELPDFKEGDEYNPFHYRSRINGKGDTNSLKKNEYHRISQVSQDGVWTLFITPFNYDEMWGFLVPEFSEDDNPFTYGKAIKVPFYEYFDNRKVNDNGNLES